MPIHVAPRSFRAVAVCAALLALAGASPARRLAGQSVMTRDTTVVARLLGFARSGRFEEAAALGRQYTALHPTPAVTAEHCVVLVGLAFSELRLQRPAPARAALGAFDASCGTVALEQAYRTEADGIRRALAAPAGPVAGDTSIVARLLQRTRTGRAVEAAELGRRHLRAAPDAAPSGERCMVLLVVAYNDAMTAQRDSARGALDTFDRSCADQPLEPGFRGEVAKIRRVLAGEPPAAVFGPRAAPAAAGSSPAGSGTADRGRVPGPPAERDGFWRAANPARAGLDGAVLDRHRALCERTGADACLVAYRGRLVQEWYGPRFATPMPAMSSTKSITGLLVGMLIDDGKIRSLDARVCEYLADWCDGVRGRVTLRHLVTMTSGLPTMQDGRSVGFAADKNAHVRRLAPEAEPGARWAYSNEGAQLLSPILDAAAGEPIQDYARRRLFEPLGMRHTRLRVDTAGHAWTYADMETTPRDLARVGLLMSARGTWQGRRIVSARWVDASVRPSQPYNREYGLLWWTALPTERRYAALGYLDTNLQVMPDEQLVVVRMQARPTEGRANPEYQQEAFALYPQFVARHSRQ